MARNQESNNRKPPIIFAPLIVLLWALVKIGQIEFTLLRWVWTGFKTIPIMIGLPFLYLAQGLVWLVSKVRGVKLEVTMPNPFAKKRGRPRTQPFLPFYISKVLRFLDFIFPKPLRIGVAVIVVSVLFFWYSYVLVLLVHDLPNPNRLREPINPLTNEFYDRNGKLLYRLYEGKNRQLIKLSDVSPDLLNATIAIEDKNFYSHPGIDLFGVGRALVSNLQHNSLQGGSTLTQQLVRNIFLTQDRTWKRKIQEVLLSFWTEQIFSKDDILAMYINEIPYGGVNIGVEAASETYLGKKAKDLELGEAAYLAGLTASPTAYSPYGPNPELGKKRQQDVLRRMVEDGYITEEQANAAAAEEIVIKPYRPSLLAPHFVMYVRSFLEEKYGARYLTQGGLRVITTLDLDTQTKVENIVSEEVAKIANLNVTNGAAMVTDPRSGQILAMVGSHDYYDPRGGNFNVAVALRQPGSSIKPITYAAAFKAGLGPGTIMLDTPTSFKDGVNVYAPVNYDGTFHGAVTIRTALGSSYNLPAVKALAIVGLPSMLQTARDMGITTFNDQDRYGLSLTLGAGEVRLIDMMTVYSTFSQMGVKHYPTPILKITDAQGNVLEDNTQGDAGIQVLNPGIAYMITDILKDNKARTPAFGPKSLLVLDGQDDVAVKTGTTDNKKDNWTFGYTANLTVGVWVGNNNGQPMDARLTSGVTGAAPIWNKIMLTLLPTRDKQAFIKPVEVLDGSVDGSRDLVLSNLEQRSVVSRQTKKDEKLNITFTDPFSTYTQDLPKAITP